MAKLQHLDKARTQPLESWLNEWDVAEITGMSIGSVRRWRLFSQGPIFRKLGSAVRYAPADVAAWLNSRPTGGARKAA